MSLPCSGDVSDDEWNLLYVAVTRARTSLIITKTVRRILTVAGVRQTHTLLVLNASAGSSMFALDHYMFKFKQPLLSLLFL